MQPETYYLISRDLAWAVSAVLLGLTLIARRKPWVLPSLIIGGLVNVLSYVILLHPWWALAALPFYLYGFATYVWTTRDATRNERVAAEHTTPAWMKPTPSSTAVIKKMKETAAEGIIAPDDGKPLVSELFTDARPGRHRPDRVASRTGEQPTIED